MLKTLCLVVVAATAASAEPTLEFVRASSNLPTLTAVKFVAGPRDGSVSGTINGVDASVTFSRRSGVITGALEQQGVTLSYTGDGNSAEGSAFGTGADYAAKTNDDGSFTFTGHVRGQGFSYTYSDSDHYVKGSIGGRSVDVTFDPDNNSARGTAGGQEFRLDLDAASGKLTGTIEGRRVELTLVNEGLGNFLENLFLFVK